MIEIKEQTNEKTMLPNGTVVRFLPSLGKERSPEHWVGKILYYPKTKGILTIRKRIEGHENEDIRINVFANVRTVMVRHLVTGNTLRIAADCIDTESPEALRLRFNMQGR